MKAYLSKSNLETIAYISSEENAVSDINTQYHERAGVAVQPRGERYIASRIIDLPTTEEMTKEEFNELVSECDYDTDVIHTGGIVTLCAGQIVGVHTNNKYYSNSK